MTLKDALVGAADKLADLGEKLVPTESVPLKPLDRDGGTGPVGAQQPERQAAPSRK